MSSPNVKELYDCYEIVNNSEEKDEIKKAAYEKILRGVTGEEKEKRLSSQFISCFFKLFPSLYEESFNKLLDLCEDENVVIRKQVIQYLSTIAKSVPEYIPKIADTLTQMLITDDNTEVSLIYSALNSVIGLDNRVALEAVFNQLETQLEESGELVNSFALKYLGERFQNEGEIPADVDTLVDSHSTKLLERLSGKDEFALAVAMLAPLRSFSGLAGRQRLVGELSRQAKLIISAKKEARPQQIVLSLLPLCKQTAKLLSKNVQADELLQLCVENACALSKQVTSEGEENANSGDAVTVNDLSTLCELLQCVVDMSSHRSSTLPSDTTVAASSTIFTGESGLQSVHGLLQCCYNNLPPVSDDVSEEMLGRFSENHSKLRELECLLLALYNLCKIRPDALGHDDELLKKFRQRLQFLGRINQLASKSVNEALRTAPKGGDNRDKVVMVKAVSNLQQLIRDFFKPASTFRTILTPSWNAPVESPVSNKRPQTGNSTDSAVPAKSRPVRYNNYNNNSNRRRR